MKSKNSTAKWEIVVSFPCEMSRDDAYTRAQNIAADINHDRPYGATARAKRIRKK